MDLDSYERLLRAAFHYISFRLRSEHEIRIFLQKKFDRYGLDDKDVLTKVVERLRELDYVNDEKFARWLIESRQKHSSKGIRVIKKELSEKGISKDLIESLLSDSTSHSFATEQNELAKTVLRKKMKLWEKYPVLIRKKKAYEFLLRRGFDHEAVAGAIDGMFGKDYNTTIE